MLAVSAEQWLWVCGYLRMSRPSRSARSLQRSSLYRAGTFRTASFLLERNWGGGFYEPCQQEPWVAPRARREELAEFQDFPVVKERLSLSQEERRGVSNPVMIAVCLQELGCRLISRKPSSLGKDAWILSSSSEASFRFGGSMR